METGDSVGIDKGEIAHKFARELQPSFHFDVL